MVSKIWTEHWAKCIVNEAAEKYNGGSVEVGVLMGELEQKLISPPYYLPTLEVKELAQIVVEGLGLILLKPKGSKQ